MNREKGEKKIYIFVIVSKLRNRNSKALDTTNPINAKHNLI